jgi:peroxiredoxin
MIGLDKDHVFKERASHRSEKSSSSPERRAASARNCRKPKANDTLPRKRTAMTLQIGGTAPDFEAMTTEGRICFHDWIGDSWAVLFSHPKDFTPVCTTELGNMARLKPEFDRRNVKIIGLSVDPIDKHAKRARDIEETQGFAPNYQMIGDPDLSISKAWGMLPAAADGDASKRTASDNQTDAQCLHHRARQEDQAHFGLSDDHGSQLRRGLARDRFAATRRQAQSGDPGELEAGRGRHYRRLVTDEAARKAIRKVGRPRAPTFASCRNRAAESTRFANSGAAAGFARAGNLFVAQSCRLRLGGREMINAPLIVQPPANAARSSSSFTVTRPEPAVTGFYDETTGSVQYVVADPITRSCAIIDPVLDFDPTSGTTRTTSADRLLRHIEAHRAFEVEIGSVFTADLERWRRIAGQIDSGMAFVSHPTNG